MWGKLDSIHFSTCIFCFISFGFVGEFYLVVVL